MTDRIFAGQATLSTSSLLITAPIGIFAAVISDAFATWDTRVIWLVTGIIAQLGLSVIVIVGRSLGASRHRGTVVLTVITAAAVRAVIIVGLLPIVGAKDPLTSADRLLGATLTLTMWMLLIGAALEALTRTRTQLAALLARVDIALAEADALQRVFAQEVSKAASSTITDLERAARELHRAIDRQLRPLSHRLWFGVTSPHVWRQVVTRIAAQPIPIAPVTILLAWSLAWNSFLRFGATLAVQITVVSIGSLAVALLMGRALAEHFTVPPVIANPITVAMATLLSSLALLGYPFSDNVSASQDVSGWIGVGVTNLSVLMISMVIASTYRARADQTRELTDAVDDLEPRRRAAASFLHNSVNSSWRALAMQLDVAARTGDVDYARRALEQVRIESTRAGFIEHEEAGWARLTQTPARWAGLAHIRVDIDGEVPTHLRSPISQLVDEAITNAVRHGRARHVEAFIQVAPDAVEVVVVDDGSVDESGSPAGGTGLGTAWLDSQATWNRVHDEGGSRLTVRWPCLP